MILLEKISKKFGRTTVVDNVSLEIPSGTAFGFLGPNGAGKTTTMKILVGLLEPDSGQVLINNKKPSDTSARIELGYMPESPYLYERLSGLEFLNFMNELFPHRHRMNSGEIKNLLNHVGLSEAVQRPIRTYSKGMRQRLGFAQTMLNHPHYLLLDEPLDGLDPLGRQEIKKMITHLRNEGRTVFFNSHILYDTEELCDQIGILHHGRLLYTGGTTDFCRGHNLETRFVELINQSEQS